MESPIVVEQTYTAPAADVWKAITEPARMRQWFFETINDFKPTVGFETRFVVTAEGVDYPHLWTVMEVVPEARIVYRWRYGGLPGDSTVAWVLAPTTAGTKLTLTHTGHETFPREPTFSRETGEAAWSYFIQDRLKAYLETRPR